MRGLDDRTRPWWILGATACILGLTVLDETIVGVALVTLRADLAMSQVESHWVVNAYLLTFTCWVAIGGRMGDSLGHRGSFVAGAAIFAVASLASGLAPSGGALIAARAAQGVGAAAVFPAAMTMATGVFPPERRGLALGIQTTVAALFMSLGPLVGGLVTQAVSWRWIFWINLPVILGAVAIVLLCGPGPGATGAAGTARGAGRVDYGGPALLIAALSALVVALMEGADWGWGAPATLALLAAGTALLGLFARVELRAPRPLFELALFRLATFTGGDLVFFAFQFNKMVVFVFVALYLQEVLHASPVQAGSAVFVGVLPTLATSLLAGRAADRWGARRPLLPALLLNGAAVVLIGLTTALASYALVVVLLVVWGATLPFLAVPARRALMSAVPEARRGQASGLNLTIQMLGGTVGIALCGAILATTGDYRAVFLLTGGLTVAAMPPVWTLIDRRPAPAAPRPAPHSRPRSPSGS